MCMRSFLLTPLFFVFSITINGQNTALSKRPEQVVQAQLEAYNAQDIDAFLSTFHEDASLWRLGEVTPLASGRERLSVLYSALFAQSPELNSTVINRSVIGNKVIDYERITGRNGQPDPFYLVMVYEVREGLIYRAFSISE